MLITQIQQAFQLIYDCFQNWLNNAWIFRTTFGFLELILRPSWIQVQLQIDSLPGGFCSKVNKKPCCYSSGTGNAVT